VNFYIQGKTALAKRPEQKVHPGFPVSWFLFSAPWMLSGKIRGKNRPSAFFDDNGAPPMEPKISNE
jgi:hypothetical protein